jgi:hypothetical protein
MIMPPGHRHRKETVLLIARGPGGRHGASPQPSTEAAGSIRRWLMVGLLTLRAAG